MLQRVHPKRDIVEVAPCRKFYIEPFAQNIVSYTIYAFIAKISTHYVISRCRPAV